MESSPVPNVSHVKFHCGTVLSNPLEDSGLEPVWVQSRNCRALEFEGASVTIADLEAKLATVTESVSSMSTEISELKKKLESIKTGWFL